MVYNVILTISTQIYLFRYILLFKTLYTVHCKLWLLIVIYISKAIRISYTATTDTDIAEYISKWLAQVTVCIARLKEGEKESHDDKQ